MFIRPVKDHLVGGDLHLHAHGFAPPVVSVDDLPHRVLSSIALTHPGANTRVPPLQLTLAATRATL